MNKTALFLTALLPTCLLYGCIRDNHSSLENSTSSISSKQSPSEHSVSSDGASEELDSSFNPSHYSSEYPSTVSSEPTSALPDPSEQHISLSVPAITQENGYYCGPAVLQSLLAYHGIHASQDELAAELHTDPVTGTEYEDLARMATDRLNTEDRSDQPTLIYRAEMFKDKPFTDEEADLFLSRLAEKLKNGDPFFVGLNCAVTRPQDGISATHLVLICGMTYNPQTGEILRIDMMDPSYLSQRDGTAFFTFPTETIIEAIRECEEGAYVW